MSYAMCDAQHDATTTVLHSGDDLSVRAVLRPFFNIDLDLAMAGLMSSIEFPLKNV